MTDKAEAESLFKAFDPQKRDGHTVIRERNREAILAAAYELFTEQDFETVSVRDIVARAEVALGTFYNHFADKNAVFRMLINRHIEAVTPRMRAIRRSATSFPEWLERYFRYLFNEVLENQTTYNLFHRNAAAVRVLAGGPAHIAGMNVLREDIEDATAKGLLAPVDVELLTMAIVGISVELIAVMARRGPGELENMVQFATKLLLSGVTIPEVNDF